MVTIDDFQKLEIKIGKVKSVEKVANADKLLRFVFDFGSEERQVLAAIAQLIDDPQTLVGKEMPVLVNLEPKMLRGHESQGMIIAADLEGKPIFLHPASEIPPGSIVK